MITSFRGREFGGILHEVPGNQKRVVIEFLWGEGSLKLNDFLFFFGADFVYFLYVVVCYALHLILGLIHLIFLNFFLVFQLLEHFIGFSPMVPDGNLAVLSHFFCHFRQLFTSLLSQRRDGYSDDLSVIHGSQAQF